MLHCRKTACCAVTRRQGKVEKELGPREIARAFKKSLIG
jgi:hypothetical protein